MEYLRLHYQKYSLQKEGKHLSALLSRHLECSVLLLGTQFKRGTGKMGHIQKSLALKVIGP